MLSLSDVSAIEAANQSIMDIELLSKMVRELLPDHHEVGLPGLGTFVSEFVPASFSDRGYTINPPYKRVSFIPGSVTDDSLVKLFALSNGIDDDQALAFLQHFLENTKKVLLDQKVVVFPGLGRLRATRQNNIFFITDESLDIYPEGFGLAPVSLKNHEESPAEVHHVVESLADILVAPVEEPAAPAESREQSAEPEEILELAEEKPAEPVEQAEPAEAAAAAEQAEVAEPAEPAKPKYRTPKTRVRRKLNKWVWLAPLLVLILFALAAAVFMILVQVAPDFIDTLLYTPEELRIINY